MINNKNTELIHSSRDPTETHWYAIRASFEKSQLALSPEHKKFISKSSFFLISSCSNKGECEISPRGDEPGFVEVINDKTFIFIEKPGNRRLDTLSNLDIKQEYWDIISCTTRTILLKNQRKAELSYQVSSKQ